MPQTLSSPAFTRRTSYAVPARSPSPLSAQFILGREAILARQPLLARLARRTGQTGDADSLAYFLATPDSLQKKPWLLLIGDHGKSASGVVAAVLLFEYRALLGNTRVFATEDGSGRRDVLAEPSMRARAAAFAARTLIHRGAHIVHLAFSETHHHADTILPPDQTPAPGLAEQFIASEFRAAHRIPATWVFREHDTSAFLPLLSTFDQTVANIGQRTRSNLRYYRRRAEADLGASFVPVVDASLDAFLAFNRECTYAVSDSLVAFRHKASSTLPNFCVRGVRDRNGRWLSLVGLRRQHNVVEIDWQMNRAELPAHSLGTVMRSFLIEHEIALGSTRLYIEGGTPQPIGRSFVKQRTSELTVKRNSTYVRLLERFGSLIFPPKNYIGQTLADPDLLWKPW